ncbi:MAG: AAA family ATPase [Planctomycetes bacterium]|nr:AAA family ATPase [Planctomycetota bacterium]
MKAHEHFGLKLPPFESWPDPRFFVRSAGHQEVLATLQYALYANKACCIVVGDSGSGKTLLARVLCGQADRRTTVLWVHGIGQPERGTEVTIHSPAGLRQPALTAESKETTLADWWRSQRRAVGAPLLVIDDADELPASGWHDVIALLTREAHRPHPVNVVLLGLPRLRHILAVPELERLRRRLFRVVTMTPLSRAQVREYVDCRIAAAGGEGERIFTDEASDEIHSLTHGNPSLINLVCDNALIEAYSEGRTQIDAEHVRGATRAALGGVPAPGQTLEAPLTGNALSEHALPTGRIRAVALPGGARASRPALTRTVATPPVAASGALARRDPAVEHQLGQLEARLSRALSTVRQARDGDGNGAPVADKPCTVVTPTAGSVNDTRAVIVENPSLDERLGNLAIRLTNVINKVREARLRCESGALRAAAEAVSASVASEVLETRSGAETAELEASAV